MKRRDLLAWAGAALQIVVFQQIIWALMAGEQPYGLVAAALAIGAAQFGLYRFLTRVKE